jgi:hypothetical protein
MYLAGAMEVLRRRRTMDLRSLYIGKVSRRDRKRITVTVTVTVNATATVQVAIQECNRNHKRNRNRAGGHPGR